MKTIACYLYFISIILISSELYALTLNVQDPQNRWKSAQGSIDSATLTIKPLGAYCEYSYYLYFSSKGSNWTNQTDTFEVVYDFELPDNSFVTDSWLWVEDTLVKAMLIDRAVAEQIYEGIVKRRRDPSILYKNSQTQYELRIFPLAGNRNRKVKITWLQPVLWNANNISFDIPLNLITISRVSLPSLRIMLFTNEEWKNPKIGDNPVTRDTTDEFFGNCKVYTLPRSEFGNNFVVYDSPLQNGTYIQCVSINPDEGYYQLVMLPKLALDFSVKKKVLFIIDFDPGKTDYDLTYVLGNLKNTVLNSFTVQDSFNIMLSFPAVKPASNTWIQATPENINTIFNQIKNNDIAAFTNLPQLFFEAITYIKNNGQDASIALLGCSSDGLGNYKSANPVIDNIKQLTTFPLQINIIDYSKYRGNFSQNNKTYKGNEYFYNFLSQWSGGYYHDALKEGSNFNLILTNLISEMEGDIKSFELYTTLENGFCYGRFNVGNSSPSTLNHMIAQVGKYYGSPPFKVKATGFHKSVSFNKDLTIDAVPIVTSDKTLEQIWIGTYIKTLELGTKTNDVIREIVDLSMDNRVLSLYTAFLALEPWRTRDTTGKEADNDDDRNTDVIDKNIVSNSGITVYPNPFSSSVTISFNSMKSGTMLQSIAVYDVIGNIVRTFNIDGLENNLSSIIWDGKDNSGSQLPNGTYLLVINTNKGPVTIKLIIFR